MLTPPLDPRSIPRNPRRPPLGLCRPGDQDVGAVERPERVDRDDPRRVDVDGGAVDRRGLARGRGGRQWDCALFGGASGFRMKRERSGGASRGEWRRTLSRGMGKADATAGVVERECEAGRGEGGRADENETWGRGGLRGRDAWTSAIELAVINQQRSNPLFPDGTRSPAAPRVQGYQVALADQARARSRKPRCAPERLHLARADCLLCQSVRQGRSRRRRHSLRHFAKLQARRERH